MRLRSLRSWLLAGWLLSLGGCASSEEGHRHDGAHEHDEESPLHDAMHATPRSTTPA